MSVTRLVLLPGLGADARMFEGQRAVAPDLEVPEWIEPNGHESLASYAERMAKTIQPGGRMLIGGSSFGGMVALEMARHLDVEGVILIGSCVHPNELSLPIRWSARLSGLIPNRCTNVIRVIMPRALSRMKPGGREQRVLLEEMSRGVPMPYIMWAARAMVQWTGAEDLGKPVHRVHGSLDPVIQPKRMETDMLIEAAGHVPSMSHPEEVNRFLKSVFEQGSIGNKN